MQLLFEWTTRGPKETHRFGSLLGECLAGGETIALTGQLGSGKTTLAGGILQGVGIDGPYRSPSFTLVREYSARLTVFHVDLYRLDAQSVAEDLDWDLMLSNEAVTVIEWADRAPLEFLPPATLHIRMHWRKQDRLSNVDIREITCEAADARWEGILLRVADSLEG